LSERSGLIADEPPRLVVVLAIDQLRPDRLTPGLAYGLGRLQREGRVFSEAALRHAFTETCPGHATMLTGRHPGPAGVPGNRFIPRDSDEKVYCVADDGPAGELVLASASPRPSASISSADPAASAPAGRSPVHLRVTTLGDWLSDARPETRVFSVSAKDRSAIMLGGQRPDGVYWIDKDASGGFATSAYYLRGGASAGIGAVVSMPNWVMA